MARDNNTPQVKSSMSVSAVAAFVLSFLLPPLGLLLGIAAIFLILRAHPRKRGMGSAVAAVILGVLFTSIGVMGLLAFKKFIKRAGAAEAIMNIEICRSGAAALLEKGEPLPRSSGWTPTMLPTSKRYPYPQEIWFVSPWKELEFKTAATGFFQYRFVNQGTRFVCQARGNQDDDDVYSLYEYAGTAGAENQRPTFSALVITNELE